MEKSVARSALASSDSLTWVLKSMAWNSWTVMVPREDGRRCAETLDDPEAGATLLPLLADLFSLELLVLDIILGLLMEFITADSLCLSGTAGNLPTNGASSKHSTPVNAKHVHHVPFLSVPPMIMNPRAIPIGPVP